MTDEAEVKLTRTGTRSATKHQSPSRAYQSTQDQSMAKCTHNPKWLLYLVESDGTISMCPNHANACWITQSPNKLSVMQMDGMEARSETTSSTIRINRNLNNSVSKLLPHTDIEVYDNKNTRKFTQHKGFPIPTNIDITEETICTQPSPASRGVVPRAVNFCNFYTNLCYGRLYQVVFSSVCTVQPLLKRLDRLVIAAAVDPLLLRISYSLVSLTSSPF